jgi:disulfide oxidoreductase YuzD
MFSHRIDSSFVLVDSYTVIPFGSRCSSAIACNYAQVRKSSLPFDWTIPTFPSKIKNVLLNDFHEFIPTDISNNIENSQCIRQPSIKTKYGFSLMHFNQNIDIGIETYKKRIERLQEILETSDAKYYVYINEDYIHNINYRNKDFNEKLFTEMIDLEETLIEKYNNNNFKILYFDFVEHNKEKSSNIIQVILESELFLLESEAPINDFRKYCGKILSDMFNTDFNVNVRKENMPDYCSIR